MKLLGQDCNHQQGFIKQKTVTLHHWGFKLIFPKHCYCDRYSQWNSSYWRLEQYWIRWLCVHSSPVESFYFTLKLVISSAELFHENSLIVVCRFRIRHTKFKKKIMKTQFQRKYEWFWKIKVCVHNSPIIRPSFHTKIGSLLHRNFPRKFPSCGLLQFR